MRKSELATKQCHAVNGQGPPQVVVNVERVHDAQRDLAVGAGKQSLSVCGMQSRGDGDGIHTEIEAAVELEELAGVEKRSQPNVNL
jgi:hypothetical protein